MDDTRIEDALVTGRIQASGTTLGGLVATAHDDLTVLRSRAEGDVVGLNTLGGLVANAGDNLEVRDSASTGEVVCSGSGAGGAFYAVGDHAVIDNTYREGDLRCSGGSAGFIRRIGDDAQVTNCHVMGDVTVSSGRVSGLIDDTGEDLFLSNCWVMGTLSASSSVEGLVGTIASGVVEDCWVDGDLSASTFGGGGLIDHAGLSGPVTIRRSYAIGSLQAASGLVVHLGTNGIIESSWSGMTISNGRNASGIVDYNQGIVRDSYSRSTLSASSDYAGISRNNYGTVERTYAVGSAAGGDGLLSNDYGTISDSYWDTWSTGAPFSDGGTGLDTATMLSPGTYAGWDLVDTWYASGSSYPCLRWEAGCAP
jgi:hypothetical protein